MNPQFPKIPLSLVLYFCLFFSTSFALDLDTLHQKPADRTAELLEDGTFSRVSRPARRNFGGVGLQVGYTGVSSLLLYGEVVVWNERPHFRIGGCLDIGTMFYYSRNYFMFSMLGEAYFLTSTPAAFYIGGGLGVTFLYVDKVLVPIPMLRTGFGLELLRGANFRIDIGPTVDIGFAPASKLTEGFIPVFGGHVRVML